MVPFVLGIICGVAASVLFGAVCKLAKSMGNTSRMEERWERERDENNRCAVQGLSEQEERMPSALYEVLRLEEEAIRRERILEARERDT